jgi:hypothetical protein
MNEGYKKSSVSIERSFFDFDVNVAFREYKGRVYLIPYCDLTMREVLDFLDEDPRIEEFGYQNQTDRPERFTPQEWAARSRVWHALTKEPTWYEFALVEVSSYGKFWRLNPWWDLAESGKIRNWGKTPPSVSNTIRQKVKE